MKSNLRGLLSSILFALTAAVLAPRAVALPMISPTPIPVGTTPADDLVVSYYFLSSTPPPPYPFGITVDISFAGWDAGETITFDFFNDQVGMGGILFSDARSGGGNSVSFFNAAPSLIDGAFSVGIRLSSGAALLIGATATAENTFPPVTVNGFLGKIPAIPEPATPALLGLGGLAGLAVSRRRKFNWSPQQRTPSSRRWAPWFHPRG